MILKSICRQIYFQDIFRPNTYLSNFIFGWLYLLSDSLPLQGLQLHLDLLYKYCLKRKLIDNIDKTKVVVFKKTRCDNSKWKTDLCRWRNKITQKFNYLVFVVSCNGSFCCGVETLAGKTLKARNYKYVN